jgi:DNA-binding CsgD family transcriptional regulator
MDKSKAEKTRRDIVRLCHDGLDARTLWPEILRLLRRVVPVEAAFFATVDPATLLFTGSTAEASLQPARQRFLKNEFLQTDVNKFIQLAKRTVPVSSLYEATHHNLQRSIRYREILVPLAMGDELRAVLRSKGVSWGALCLHRERSSPNFTPAETAFFEQLGPHLAEAIRRAALLGDATTPAASTDAPGLLLLEKNLSISAITPTAEYLLSEVAKEDWPRRQELPTAVQAVALRLLAQGADAPPHSGFATQVRLRTRAGHWLVLHASWLSGSNSKPQIAVVMEVARPSDIAPVILQAYSLSPREQEIARWILLGFSTEEIAAAAQISLNTVQDHLKSIFCKFGVHSRRELVAQVFDRHYEPNIQEGRELDGRGFFKRPRQKTTDIA